MRVGCARVGSDPGRLGNEGKKYEGGRGEWEKSEDTIKQEGEGDAWAKLSGKTFDTMMMSIAGRFTFII
jgi:hypothetical protein